MSIGIGIGMPPRVKKNKANANANANAKFLGCEMNKQIVSPNAAAKKSQASQYGLNIKRLYLCQAVSVSRRD